MKTGEAFPSKWLKAADLGGFGGNRPVVTIAKVVMEKMAGSEKPVIYFKGSEKGLVLNQTNASSIEMILGTDEMDNWVGGKVELFVTRVRFQGQLVEAIRVEEPPKPKKGAKKEDEPVLEDEEVPF